MIGLNIWSKLHNQWSNTSDPQFSCHTLPNFLYSHIAPIPATPVPINDQSLFRLVSITVMLFLDSPSLGWHPKRTSRQKIDFPGLISFISFILGIIVLYYFCWKFENSYVICLLQLFNYLCGWPVQPAI